MSLVRYVVRRLLYMIPLAIGISIISFITMYAAGDPIAIITMGKASITEAQRQAIRVYYGLDRPIPVQYVSWLVNILTGNFGTSFTYGGRPVSELIAQWFWPTVELQIISLVLSVALSIPIGIMSAKNQYSKRDLAVTSVALFGVSMPTFWLGVILIIVFSYTLSWLPSAGALGSPYLWPVFGIENPLLDRIAHLILPVSVLTYVSLAQNVRLVRANMLEVLRSDYILAARASGLSERLVLYKHALRNTITPVITYLGLSLGAVVGGAPMTEYVFNWPGLGRRFVTAATNLDFPVIMGITMIITVMTLVANLIVDISYAFVDPRISVG